MRLRMHAFPLLAFPRSAYHHMIWEYPIARGVRWRPVLVVSHDTSVMTHQMRTISRARLEDLLGHLRDTSLGRQVQQAVRDHPDLECA